MTSVPVSVGVGQEGLSVKKLLECLSSKNIFIDKGNFVVTKQNFICYEVHFICYKYTVNLIC